MEHFLFAFWWLIFPIMGMGMGALGMLTGYRVHRDRMELMKTYVEQGKDPSEVAKILGSTGPNPYGGNGGWGPGPGPWGGGPWGYGYGYAGRWGPFREWRRAVIFGCLAGGFWFASQYADWPGSERAFTLVAIIMGVLAAASLLFAIISTVMFANMSKNEK